MSIYQSGIGYQYIRLPFGAASTGHIFQRKIDQSFIGIPHVFDIADGILIAGFIDCCRDHNWMMENVLHICRQASLKLNKDKCLSRCISIPFFGEIISWQCLSVDPSKIQVLTDMPTGKMKKEPLSFLGALDHLSKFS